MNNIKRYWRIIFPILLVIIIWAFSDRNGASSSAQSNAVADMVGASNDFMRKFAHFVLFGALGYSCTCFIKGLHPATFPKHTMVFYPVIVTTIYGALDEVHQLTVVGRNGSASDVFIDVMAGIAGTLLYIAVFCFYRIWKSRRDAAKAIIAAQQDYIQENGLE